jgi:hypothetical protein
MTNFSKKDIEFLKYKKRQGADAFAALNALQQVKARLGMGLRAGVETFTGAAKRAERGIRDIGAGIKEHDTSKIGLGMTDITGAFGQGTLALPSAAFGTLQPEMETVGRAISSVVPEKAKRSLSEFSSNLPEDIKRQAGSVAYSAVGAGMLSKAPFAKKSIEDSLSKVADKAAAKISKGSKAIAKNKKGYTRFFEKIDEVDDVSGLPSKTSIVSKKAKSPKLYHGTSKERAAEIGKKGFSVKGISRRSEVQGAPAEYGNALYFTSKRRIAKGFSDKSILQDYARDAYKAAKKQLNRTDINYADDFLDDIVYEVPGNLKNLKATKLNLYGENMSVYDLYKEMGIEAKDEILRVTEQFLKSQKPVAGKVLSASLKPKAKMFHIKEPSEWLRLVDKAGDLFPARGTGAKVKRYLTRKGYDGIISDVDTSIGRQYIVYNPSVIKHGKGAAKSLLKDTKGQARFFDDLKSKKVQEIKETVPSFDSAGREAIARFSKLDYKQVEKQMLKTLGQSHTPESTAYIGKGGKWISWGKRALKEAKESGFNPNPNTPLRDVAKDFKLFSHMYDMPGVESLVRVNAQSPARVYLEFYSKPTATQMKSIARLTKGKAIIADASDPLTWKNISSGEFSGVIKLKQWVDKVFK